MSDSLQLYNDYLCYLMIYGYTRTVIGKEMLRDICCVCINFINIPSNFIAELGYDIGKIEYLLLNYTLPNIIHRVKTLNDILYSANGTRTYAYQNWKPVLDGKKWTKCHFPLICKIKDKTLLNSLSICLNWSWMLRERHLNIGCYFKYDLCNKHLNVIIDIAKKGIALKYKYVCQLLSMYDYYYFDLYILKLIKQKLNGIESKALMKALQQTVIQELNNSNVDFDGKFDFEQWNNSNAMKMSSLLQTIPLIYTNNVEDVMKQLSNIADIIEIKYKIIESHLSTIIDQEQKSFGDDNGSVLNQIIEATVFIPSIIVCVTEVAVNKIAGDTLDWMFGV
eukprot:184543_1